MSDDLHRELETIKTELCELSGQLEVLLARQEQLVDRKKHVEELLQERKDKTTSQSNEWETAEYPWSSQLPETARSVFGIEHFRSLQKQTMNVTLSGRDCILIMPTGGGKSLCFQLPALLSEGFTLVICPLVSLMEDQQLSLRRRQVAVSILTAATAKEDVTRIQSSMADKAAPLKLLYVTPEKLAKSKRFMAKLEKAYSMKRLARIAIDEVHCCSQWGHDFRPDYKFLGVLKRQFPDTPILGLTATATNSVIKDVRKILAIPDSILFRASFNRHNLFYEVRQKPDSAKDCYDEIQSVIETRFKNQSGIIYCFSRKDTEELARQLCERGIRAAPYHADIPADHRSQVHTRWVNANIQVVVATVAFGMGIDKPDVRFVIHHSISKSMENYYQESGRAGRDDGEAYCIVYRSFSDVFRQSTMVFTEQTGLEKLYGMAGYAYNTHRCRRQEIARHFGEEWKSTLCKDMCDHCKHAGSVNKKDITSHVKDILRILQQASSTQQRVTGLKLLDAWQGKGPVPLRVKGVKPPYFSRRQCESVVVCLLLRGYLREDFHFTPYSTISYLLPGPRSQMVQNGGHTVEMEFPSSIPAEPKPKKPASSTETSAPKSKTQAKTSHKPKKTDNGLNKHTNKPKSQSSDKTVVPKPSTQSSSKSSVSSIEVSDSDEDFSMSPSKTKRRSAVLDSDSEGSEWEDISLLDRPTKNPTKKPCIVIDTDDDT